MVAELLKTEEAAKLLHVSPAVLVRWRRAGIGPVIVTIGRKIFYTHAGLNDWLESQTRQPTRRAETAR